MFKVSDFTRPKLKILMEEGNLTERERTLLDLKNQGVSDEQCAEIMNMSKSTVSRTMKGLRVKAVELGLIPGHESVFSVPVGQATVMP